MLHEKQLRSFLISAFEHLKEQRMALSSALAEIAAVRDALIEIGPKYDDILTRHRANHVRESRPILGEALQQYETIIEQLRGS